MSAENTLVLVGNVGSSESIRTVQGDGDEVIIVSFSLAVTEYRYNPETKQNEKMTDWQNAKAFGWVAPRLARFVEQGQRLLLKGRLYKETYEKDGVNFTTQGIQVEEFTLLGGGSERNSSDQSEEVVEEAGDDEFPF